MRASVPMSSSPTGQSELASRALTLDAVKGMLNELLPAEARQTLDEIGAVQHDLGTPAFAPGQTFSVVAARGGDDIWIEIRRHRKPVHVEAPVEVAPVAPEPEPEPVVEVCSSRAGARTDCDRPSRSRHPRRNRNLQPEPEPELESEPAPCFDPNFGVVSAPEPCT